MKEKIKRISSSTWALLLALMMVVSSFSVLAATTNVNKSGAGASGGKISRGDILYYDYSSITEKGVNYSDGTTNLPYAEDFSGAPNNAQWVADKVLAVTMQADLTFNSSSRVTVAKTSQGDWTDMYANQVPSDGQNCIKINSDGKTYTWTTYGGSTTGDIVYIYGDLSSEYSNQWEGFTTPDSNKFTYDADNHKYVLNNLSLDKTPAKFRIWDKTTDTHYTTSSTNKMLTSGVKNTIDDTGWKNTFQYNAPASKKVNIEITGDFKYITVTDVETPTETTPTVTTPVGGDGYYLYNGSESFDTSSLLGEFSGGALSVDLTAGTTYRLFVHDSKGKNYFHENKTFDENNKSCQLYPYSVDNFSHAITFKPTTTAKYKFTWTISGSDYHLSYEMETEDVAGNVVLTTNANDNNISYGTDLDVTASLADPNASKFTYKFYLDGSTEPTATFTDVTDNSYTYTFSGLAEGEHTIKVEVSSDGYNTVSATTTVTVVKNDVATGLQLSANSTSIDYGNTVTLSASVATKVDGEITYTFEEVTGDSSTEFTPIKTSNSNAGYVVSGLSVGQHVFRVTVSADNYNSVVSNTVTVTVNPIDITSKVTLTGPVVGYEYKVGDSIKLEASCENAPEGVTVKYNYYINGKKINGSATPNKVTYDFTASDEGTVTFYAEAVAENYNTVKSEEISASVIKKQVATSVKLTATPTNVKFGNEVTIIAELQGDIQPGNFTYTFKETNVNGVIQSVQSDNGSATITTSDLAVGTHNISVTVSGTNFESITSSEDLIVTVSEAYHDEEVNKTSGKTILISYDTTNQKVRNYTHIWVKDGNSIVDGNSDNGAMTDIGSITGLYYKDATDAAKNLADNAQLGFVLMSGKGKWQVSRYEYNPNENGFKKGMQWYVNANNNNNTGVYTPLTFTKLNVPTEINDDDSTRFIFDVTGGLPYFFGKTVGTANDNAVYTVKITGPNGYEVTKTAKYYADTTQITLDKLTIPATGDYTFTVSDGIDEVSVIKTLEVTPLVVDNYNATVNPSDNATITVTCKDTTITGGNTGELPEKRNAIIRVTDIKDGYKVNNVTVKSGTTQIPVTSQGNNQYLFTMPSSDVTITVDVVAKSNYAVKFNVSDKTGGSITAKSGETTIKSGSRVVEDTSVTFEVKLNSDDYKVNGWYSDSTYTTKINGVEDGATSYTTRITGATNVYVKIVENPGTLCTDKWFITGTNSNPTSWDTRLPVYEKNGSYYVNFDISTITKGDHYYAITSKKTGTIASSDMIFHDGTLSYNSADGSVVKNQNQPEYWAGSDKFTNYGMFSISNYDDLRALSLKVTPSDNGTEYLMQPKVIQPPTGAIDVYAKNGTLKTTYAYGDTTVTGINDDCTSFTKDLGKYKQYKALANDRLTITTVVNDTQAEQGWYVSNYVINGVGYDAISTVKAQAAVQAGSTGASYTIATPYPVTGNETKNIIEITPIYKNRNIEADNDYITLYANADSLGDRWGNTISVYSYYYKNGVNDDKTNKNMNSAYPGEPMMKTSSGLYVAYVPKNAWDVVDGTFQKLSDYEVSGITFNNYKEGEEIHQKTLTPDQNKNFQTYDYDDFKYIAAAGYDTVLFDFQYRKAENSNQKTLVENSTTEKDMKGSTIDVDTYKDTTAHNGWDLLTNMDGEEASILGYTAKTVPKGQTFNSTDKLRIVSVGNIDTSMGDWSTIWYVYDSAGNYVTQGLPSDFIPRYTTDADDNLKESETQSTAYNAIKTAGYAYNGAYITYENEMDANTSSSGSGNTGIRSDGRWYYSRAVEQVKVNTHVLYAGADKSDWKEDTYSSDDSGVTTGAKALVGTERTTSVDRNTEVSITASALGTVTDPVQYKFIGWTTDVTKDSDGNLTVVENPSMIDSSQTVKVSTNMDLYALYIPVAKGDLIITHEKYTGENAYGGPGRYFVQATLYKRDNVTVEHTYYQEGSVTIPDYTEKSGKIDVQLIVYSVNGSKYKATYNYNLAKITDESHVDKVCSSGNPAVVAKSFTASQIFDNGVMKTNKVAYYSDLQTNNITVKMNYYNRKVENGKPADMDSTPTSYSYRFTSYPEEVLKDDGTLISIPKLIEYAKNHSQQPDNMIEKYISWNSQEAVKDAKTGITSYMNYHTNAKYVATPYHTDQYGNVQSGGEKWVTYYDRNGVEVAESEASAETVSSISIWYFNTPKKYTYTLNIANSSYKPVENGDGTFYGDHAETASGLFYNTRLFSSDREVSDASSPYTKAYGVEDGYTGKAINTAETIDNGGTPLKFLYWAYDKAGKKVASTNIQYGLRITNNTTLYAIYGEAELDAPGLTVQEVTPDTFFDSNNISKTRINTIFNPYNCKDNDKNIDSASVVYLRVASSATEKSLNNLTDDDLQELRKQISTVVSQASYKKFKSGEVDPAASKQIVKISGSTASGFKFKVVDNPTSSTELQTSLSNKNRGQFTTTFTTSTLKNYTYYVFATMGYKNYNGTAGITYITSDNFVKYKFDENGKYLAPSNS